MRGPKPRIPSTESQSEWRILYDSQQRLRLISIIEEIEDYYISHPREAASTNSPLQQIDEDIFAAVFLNYSRFRPESTADPIIAESYLDRAIDALATTAFPPRLYGGFIGPAWAVQHLARLARHHDRKSANATEDGLQEVDATLLEYLAKTPWTADFDLICGLVGHGVYGLERKAYTSGRSILASVVARLDELAERNDQGLTWFTQPHLVPSSQKDLAPNGYYNLGVAHGVPGVIGLLAGIVAQDIVTDRAATLLEGAVAWLLAQRGSSNSEFGSFVVPGKEIPSCRLAWCYGDAGIAAVLLAAARAMRNNEWEREALRIGRHAARRTDAIAAGVLDAPLCHGSTGLGHVFNRIWQATGEECIVEAARYWFDDTVSRYEKAGGLAGLLCNNRGTWEGGFGLLTGFCGIGLALIAATMDVPPTWDRFMLLDIEPDRSDREI